LFLTHKKIALHCENIWDQNAIGNARFWMNCLFEGASTTRKNKSPKIPHLKVGQFPNKEPR